MRWKWCLAALLIVATSVDEVSAAESFWSGAKMSDSSYLTVVPMPVRRFQKNDIITVIITEAAKASGTGSLERTREMSRNYKINSWFRVAKASGGAPTFRKALTEDGQTITPEWDVESSTDDQLDGSIQRQDKFETRVAAVVRDVKPNGNLLIEAKTVTWLNGEKRNISLTGIVRAEDVRTGNTVPSYCVAFAEIHYDTGGPASDGARLGWLSRVLDFINPF